jgi:hypothetical protein
MSPTTPQTTADTFGWDTVFAMRVDDVNKAIVSAKSTPTSFSQSLNNGEVVASGTFADWQICLGGDGKLLHLALPISSGTLSVPTYGTTTAFTDVTAIIEVELAFFESIGTPVAGSTGTFHDLKINTSGDAVKVLTVNYNAPTTDFMVKSQLPGALAAWLNDNLKVFDHIFATINLNRVADTGSFQWLFPTASYYAYTDRDTVEDSLLAVLCTTGGNDYTKLVPELTTNAVPAGARAGFLIHPARFLQNMVLPNLPHAFPGAQVTDFALAADGLSLTMTNPNGLSVNTTGDDGKSYSSTITALTIAIVGTTVVMNSACHTPISPGLDAYCTATHTYTIGLTTTPGGKQTLGFNESSTPVVTNWTTKSTGFEILQWMEVAVGVVATLVLGVLTSGAAFVVGAIVIGVLVGVATQVPGMIAAIGQDDAPDLSLLAFNTTDPIAWTDTKDFNLSSATLNGSLQLGGAYSA